MVLWIYLRLALIDERPFSHAVEPARVSGKNSVDVTTSNALQPRYDQETGWLVLILMLGQIAVDCWKLTRVIEAAWAHTNTS